MNDAEGESPLGASTRMQRLREELHHEQQAQIPGFVRPLLVMWLFWLFCLPSLAYPSAKVEALNNEYLRECLSQEFPDIPPGLERFLDKMSDENRNVIVTVATHAAKWIVLNLLLSFASYNQTHPGVAVLSLEKPLCEFVESKGHSCFEWNHGILQYAEEVSKFHKRGVYLQVMQRKQELVLMGLALRYNLLVVDTDVVLLQDFFSALGHFLNYEVVSQSLRCPEGEACSGVCGGFFYVRSTAKTCHWTRRSLKYLGDGKFHQVALQMSLKDAGLEAVMNIPFQIIPFLDQYAYNCTVNVVRGRVVAVHASTIGQCKKAHNWHIQERTIRGKIWRMKEVNLWWVPEMRG